VPPEFQIQHIEGQTVVHRVVMPRRPRRHEEFAIATIQPMPEGLVHFANIHDVLEDFFVNVARVGIRDVQRCPFRQAYVRFVHFRDRDWLVAYSLHQFQDVHISFAKHNEGINWRRAQLNRECWILMVGPPLDNWSTEDVTAVVCKFGRLLVWENDERNKGRIIAKVRCTELQEILKSI
jgi:hypothetical protein